ncbi:MAG: nucleoside kinase [Ruminococcaceae bacterium]|nr:nucleoside kinase [Oscillospiraceae bacterium]
MAEIELKEINLRVRNDLCSFIDMAEREYADRLSETVDFLERNGARIVLLAGPSSSGKTTTANILKDLLEMRGHSTAVVSMDNFYRDKNDPLYPRDERGELDFESVDALHIDKIHSVIESLLTRGEAKMPRYVFGKGAPVDGAITLSLPSSGFVIMEGIHALNPKITDGLDREQIIKIFISVSTNINEDGKRILSGRKIRFIRRMTRDSLYRGTDALKTLARWGSVLEGEDKYLYPFKGTADICIDTFHKYELGVMRPFAEKAIREAGAELDGGFIEIIKNALSKFDVVDINNVPETSLIREFIPGGKYESIY